MPEFFLCLPQQLGGLHHVLFILMFIKPGSQQASKVPVFIPVDAPWFQVSQRPLIKPEHLLLVGQIGRRRQERHDGRLTFSGPGGSPIMYILKGALITGFQFKCKGFSIIYFSAALHSLRDLSSLPRDATRAPAVEVGSPNHWTASEFPKRWVWVGWMKELGGGGWRRGPQGLGVKWDFSKRRRKGGRWG